MYKKIEVLLNILFWSYLFIIEAGWPNQDILPSIDQIRDQIRKKQLFPNS